MRLTTCDKIFLIMVSSLTDGTGEANVSTGRVLISLRLLSAVVVSFSGDGMVMLDDGEDWIEPRSLSWIVQFGDSRTN